MSCEGFGFAQHRAWVAVAANGDDLSVGHLNVLGERDDADDGVDFEQRDAVFPINDEADDLYALHDPGKGVESLAKRFGAPIGIRGEYANDIAVKRKRGRVFAAHRVNVLLDNLDCLFAHVAPEKLIVSTPTPSGRN